MFLAAIAHYFSFSHVPYIDVTAPQRSWWRSFTSMWDVSDVGRDVAEHVRVVGELNSNWWEVEEIRRFETIH